MKNMTRGRRILCILLAVFIVLASIAVFVQFGLKKDLYGRVLCEIYGIASDMKRGEKNLLSEAEIYTEAFTCDDVMSGKTAAQPKYTLWLVNATYPLEEDELKNIDFCEIGNGRTLCREAYENLTALFAKAKEESGDDLIVTSGFRTHEEQAALYVSSPSVAVAAGTSEHQCGFAVDVKTSGYGQRRFILSGGGKWTDENCGRFGFIVRYPHYGKKTTMVTYEPWHLRYVGYPHSEIIGRMRITLEEYYGIFDDGAFYEYGEYVISRQIPDDGLLYLPVRCGEIYVSPDNMGGYIVWAKK